MRERSWRQKERSWLKRVDLLPVLAFLQETASIRKLRLFACACGRRVWPLLEDERSRRAVEIAERYADGVVGDEQLARGLDDACDAIRDARENGRSDAANMASHVAGDTVWSNEDFRESPAGDEFAGAVDAARCTVSAIGYAAYAEHSDARASKKAELAERKALTGVIRDIFGNPFRSVVFSPTWRTSAAVALAAQMYESRDFGAMPILADALQDAGCNNEDVLSHCRTPGEHVRGCWVVDLVLDTE